ncbi:hypothetical protein AOLI_G00026990 [Acnodon oligacanthus]
MTDSEPLMIGRQWIDSCPESTLDRSPLVSRIEAVVCNGKGLSTSAVISIVGSRSPVRHFLLSYVFS